MATLVQLVCRQMLDFEEVELPRSLLEVRLETGVLIRTKKRVVRARFSYEEKKFVGEHILLDLDDKFDMVLGMPWLARHDLVIDWAKRTIVRIRNSGATESDGPVGAAHTPRGACDPPTEAAKGAVASDLSARTLTTERVVRENCEPNQKTQIRSDLKGSRSAKSDAIVSTVVDTQVEQEWPVTEDSELDASAPGANAIGSNVEGRSAVRRRGNRDASAPGGDAASSADGCKRPAPEMLACSCAARLHDEAIHNKPGLIACARGLTPLVSRRKICPRPGLDKRRHMKPGSAREANGASEPSCASLGQGPRRYKQCLPGRHINRGRSRRDPECLDY
ncbi:unnamed protein product [Phytophthora fragariaefolia]|uniref:Unnamed protein product n=1 Tax=Phytophthora fragariaefolia TaxID=1490495 RepID=A0A9W6YJQ4_9STRA|nr:unnamed protein product [Phytophthora fragariaefolia]